ncbi:MAG: hypothetical protein ACF8QF_08385 [Phycisphaerales bacterium]
MLDLVAAIVLSTVAGVGPYEIDRSGARADLLATPAPYPAGRTDSPDRLENGRLWVSRYPIGSRSPIPEGVYADPGAASYGAARGENHAVAYARVGHMAVAFDPYATYGARGLEKFRAAKNQWLREQGYVLKVRTHVNPRFHQQRADERQAGAPAPRATIRINREKAEPRNMQAMLTSWNPVSYEEWQAEQADLESTDIAASEEARPETDADAAEDHALADAALESGRAASGS